MIIPLWIRLLVSSLRNVHLALSPKDFSSVFYSKNFIVLHFTIRPMIHSKLVFVLGQGPVFSPWVPSCVGSRCWKGHSVFIFLYRCQKSVGQLGVATWAGVPATQEAEAGGSLEPRSSGLAWGTQWVSVSKEKIISWANLFGSISGLLIFFHWATWLSIYQNHTVLIAVATL
jgi:hypothetical protein